MARKGLEIGLPFKVSAVQAVQYFESKQMRPFEISARLASLGASPDRIRQALCRVRKLKRIAKRERAAKHGD